MRPTDELCKRLDELGVKYDAASYDNVVFWGDAEYELYNDGHTRLIVEGAIPEQAIAATVGEGTCRNVSEYTNVFTCSECGYEYDFVTEPYSGPNFCPKCGRRIEVDE